MNKYLYIILILTNSFFLQASSKALLEVEEVDSFHTQYESFYLKTDSYLSKIFEQQKLLCNKELLFEWRKAYIERELYYISKNLTEKKQHLEQAIIYLQANIDKIDSPFVDMLFAHSLSINYYDLGVVTKDLYLQSVRSDKDKDEEDKEEDEDEDLDYLSFFKKGCETYDSVVNKWQCCNFTDFFAKNKKIKRNINKYFNNYLPEHTYAANLYNFCIYQLDSLDMDSIRTTIDLVKFLAHTKDSLNPESEEIIKFRKNIDKLIKTLFNDKDLGEKSQGVKRKRDESGEQHTQQAFIDFSQSPLSETLTSLHEEDLSFLREHQKEPYNKIIEKLRSDTPRGLCVMPTGSGKTALMAQTISSIEKNRPNTSIIIIVPSIDLVKQTQKKLKEYSETLSPLKSIQVGTWCSYEIPSLKNVMITTQKSWINLYQKSITAYSTEESYKTAIHKIRESNQTKISRDLYFSPFADNFIIVDEAHHLGANKTKNIINNIINDLSINKPIVGFSATVSDYDLPIEVITKLELSEGIACKAISPLRVLNVNFSMFKEAKQLKKRLQITQGQSELTAEQKQEIDKYLTENAGYDLSVVDLFNQYFTPLTQLTMIFTNGILHAKNLEKVFTVCGIKAKAYHSGLNKEEREYIIRQFHEKKINVLISCGCLDEGFDLPDVKTIIDFTVYVKKQRRLFQRLGRGMRGSLPLTYVQIQILPRYKILDPREVLLGSRESWSMFPDSDEASNIMLPIELESVIKNKTIPILREFSFSKELIASKAEDDTTISKINFTEGADVKEGDVLLETNTGVNIISHIDGKIIKIGCAINQKVSPNKTLISVERSETIEPLAAWVSKGPGRDNRHKYMKPPEETETIEETTEETTEEIIDIVGVPEAATTSTEGQASGSSINMGFAEQPDQ
jgi:superfamily II DNA or RNA helicase